MIREFLSKRRIVFFQKTWANSVTQWICGIHSPSGTVKIVNTANPSKGKSAAFDVDIDAVWSRLRDRIDSLRREDDGQKLRDSKDETFGDKIQNGSTEDLTHDDITDWPDATASFANQEDVDALTDAVSGLTEATQGIVDDVDSILADYATGTEVDLISESLSDVIDSVSDIILDIQGMEADLLDLSNSVSELSDAVIEIESEYLSESEADAKYVHGADTTVIGGQLNWNGTTITQPLYRLSISNGNLSLVSTGKYQISTVTYNPQ